MRPPNLSKSLLTSVGDPDPEPDPDPQDPHFLGLHLSEVRIRIQPRILPFSHRCVERTEIMPAKLNFNTKF
jgi:hypothetical protein